MAPKSPSTRRKDLPLSLEPIYQMSAPNQNIKLYEGVIELDQSTNTYSGEGTVQFEWLPFAGLWFSLVVPRKTLDLIDTTSCTVHMPGLNRHAGAVVLAYAPSSNTGDYKIRGRMLESEFGGAPRVCYIIFHVSNFAGYNGRFVKDETNCWAARAVIETGEWRITLDKLEVTTHFVDELRATSGFAITHVGKLERLDSKMFTVKTAESVLTALSEYLSFCRGAWVAPILSVGFGETDERVWEKWGTPRIAGWISYRNWFDGIEEEEFSNGFTGFYEKWQQLTWREPLKLANHWYVEANMAASGLESSIILAQAGFELLGWTHLVEDRAAISEKGYENLAAMDKLRLLLMLCRIPAAIPALLLGLNSLAKLKANNWKDGPQALTELRNAMVHANPAKRRKVFEERARIVNEAWCLSLWYLELIILKTIEYQGRYRSRMPESVNEYFATVPWLQINKDFAGAD